MPAPKNKKRSRKGKTKSKRKVKGNNKYKNKKNKACNKQMKMNKNQQIIDSQSHHNDDNKVQNICTNSMKQCGYCSKAGAKSRCSGCKLTYYCNKECQTSHWLKHKTSCKLYRTLTQNKKNNTGLFDAKNLNKDNYYIQRINLLLNKYQAFIENNGVYDKYSDAYELICAHYPGSKANYFINDYYQYVQNIDNDHVYQQNINKCDLDECHYIQREYRDRSLYDKNANNQSTLYHNSTSEQSIVICQLLDTLHITKYHLVDIGLRYIADEKKNDNDNDKNKILIQMRDNLSAKRERFNKIRKDIPSNKISNTNKFITEIFAEEKGNDDVKGNYGFGFRFYYHSYYQYNQSTIEALPRAPPSFVDYGNSLINPKYTFAMWFVKAKYKSMKDEVLYGVKQKISTTEYENTYKKAVLKLNGLQQKMQGSMFVWQTLYGIPANSPITLKHILSVLFYTNFTTLSAEFSQSFRRLSTTESDESVKLRHSKYANWAKHLRETIECWGHSSFTQTPAAANQPFYHGLSCKMMFKGFRERFYGPMSSTLQYSTAVMFASQESGAGIVISINNMDYSCVYFNCVPWSDFPGEYEMLFVGGFNPVNISGLTSIGDGMQYDEWIKSITIFQTGFVHGHASRFKIEDGHKQCIVALVNGVLELNDGNNEKCVPKYIGQLFRNLLLKTKTLQIGIDTLAQKMCGMDVFHNVRYGYKSLKHLYFDAKNHIKWNTLRMLFPSVDTIHIFKTEKIPNTFNQEKRAPSILITEELLKNILIQLSNSVIKWKFITIYYPQNTQKTLDVLIHSYQALFNKCGCVLMVGEIDHPQYGSCKSFQINSII